LRSGVELILPPSSLPRWSAAGQPNAIRNGLERKDDDQAPASSPARRSHRSAINLRPHRQPRRPCRRPSTTATGRSVGNTVARRHRVSHPCRLAVHVLLQPSRPGTAHGRRVRQRYHDHLRQQPNLHRNRHLPMVAQQRRPHLHPSRRLLRPVPTRANTDVGYLDPPLTPAQASEAADPHPTAESRKFQPETAGRYPARAYRTLGPLTRGPGQRAPTR